jgi:hypothetical protein
LSAANLFIGPAPFDDTADSYDGGANYDLMTPANWVTLDNDFRAWGRPGSTFPASNQTGLATTSTDVKVYDWRLLSTDTVALNKHGAFTNGAACPASVHGDQVINDNQQQDYFTGIVALENNGAAGGDNDGICEAGELCLNRFLKKAMEITMDNIGDDDGLCESNETCIYTPNVGAYQGEGDYTTQSCTFTNGGAGGVTGVTMKGYPTNGAQ